VHGDVRYKILYEWLYIIFYKKLLNFLNVNKHFSYINIGLRTLYSEIRLFCNGWILKTKRLSTRKSLKKRAFCGVCLYFRCAVATTHYTGLSYHISPVIIIINIKDCTLGSVPSPEIQLLTPTFLRSPNCSPSLWSVVV